MTSTPPVIESIGVDLHCEAGHRWTTRLQLHRAMRVGMIPIWGLKQPNCPECTKAKARRANQRGAR